MIINLLLRPDRTAAGKMIAKVLVLLVSLITMIVISGVPETLAQSERKIMDLAGREVTLPSQVKKIVTTFKPATLCALSLGLADRLVGVEESSKKEPLQLEVYPRLFQAAGVGDKSRGVNLEAVVALKPDLAVLYAQKDGLETADRLAALGIAAVIIYPEDFPGLVQSLQVLAEAVGEPWRAAKVQVAMDRILNLVHNRVGALPAASRPVVYYASPQDFFSTASGQMLQDDMITRAGGLNAGHGLNGYFQPVSPEQVLAWNPDLIAVSRRIAGSLKENLNRSEIRMVKAMTAGRVYVFPSELAPWDFPSPLTTLGVLWLGVRLHPDLFRDLDLLKEVNEFHAILFNRTFAEMGGRLADQVAP